MRYSLIAEIDDEFLSKMDMNIKAIFTKRVMESLKIGKDIIEQELVSHGINEHPIKIKEVLETEF